MRIRLIALCFLLLGTPAFGQQLEDPKTITAASSSCTSASCVEISTRGVLAIGINVTGAGTYTLEIEASKNSGSTWDAFNAIDESDTDTLVQEITAAGNFSVVNSGITNLRIRASALSSGTPVVTLARGYLNPLTEITAGGGGSSATEYTENASDTTITGVVAMMEVASDVIEPIQGTVADGLLVNLGSNNDVTGSLTNNNGAPGATNLGVLPARATQLVPSYTEGNQVLASTNLSGYTRVTQDTSYVYASSYAFGASDRVGIIGGVYDATPATLSDGGTSPLLLDTLGNLKVTATDFDVQSGGADILSTTVFNAAFGTAGSSDTQVLSVQGIASGTALPISGSISCSNCSGSGASDVDDSSFGVASDSVAPIGALFDDNTPDSVDEGDDGIVRMSANRNLYTTIRDAAGNERGVNVTAQNELLVELGAGSAAIGTVTVTDGAGALNVIVDSGALTVSGTDIDVQSGGADILSTTAFNAAFGTAGSADTQVLSVQGIASGTALTVSATNLDVQIGGSDTVAVSNTGLTELAAAINSNLVDVNIVSGAGSGGTALADDADFTAGTTNFTPVGGFYQSSVTACTDGDTCAAGITAGRAVKVALANADGSLLTVASDWTASSAIGTTAPGQMLEAKDFDGSALPQTASAAEGDAIPAAGSLTGIQYMMLVSEDGSLQYGTSTTPLVVGDGSGALNVIVDSGSITVTDGAGALNTIIDSGTVTTVSTVTTLSQFGGNAINLGSGSIGTGTLRMTIATDDPVNDAAVDLSLALVVEDLAETADNQLLGIGAVRRDTLASSAGASGDNATINTNAVGALWTTPSASTNGGADGLKYTSAGSTEDEHAVKATAGTLYSITATNTNAAVRYIRCENDTAANTTPGSETPELDLAIPGATTGAGITFSFPVGYSFSTALTCWLVTGAADTDVAEVAANEIKVFYSFK